MISVVIPFYNEQNSIKELVASLFSCLEQCHEAFEIVMVDDGSTDGSLDEARELLKLYPGLTLVSLRRNQGKSAALAVGIEHAKGEIILTMDADLQDDPADIPRFLEALQGLDLVCGWRRPRRDSLYKRLQSVLYNWALRAAGFRVVHDINCGFKAMRREVANGIPLSGRRHRLIPLVASWQGYRVGEVTVNHRPRKQGTSKYGTSRFAGAIFDIFTALLLSRFWRRLLSVIGTILALVGLTMCSYVTGLKIATGSVQYHYPLLILGVMLLILGVQLVLTGFLSEFIALGRGRPSSEYSIKLIDRSQAGKSRPSQDK